MRSEGAAQAAAAQRFLCCSKANVGMARGASAQAWQQPLPWVVTTQSASAVQDARPPAGVFPLSSDPPQDTKTTVVLRNTTHSSRRQLTAAAYLESPPESPAAVTSMRSAF